MTTETTTSEEQTPPRKRHKVRALSTVQRREVKFLWYPYIPEGRVTLMEGNPETGKSFAACALAAAISAGERLPGQHEDFNPEPRAVFYFTVEDVSADTIRPRIEDAGGDLEKVFITHVDSDPTTGVLILNDEGLAGLKEDLEKHDPVLMILDPLFGFFDAQTDIHRANETRQIMTKLFHLAQQHHLSVLAIRHWRKSGGNKSVAGLGSIDILAAVRSVVAFGHHPNDESDRAMVHTKSNLSLRGKPLGFEITGDRNGKSFFKWKKGTDLTFDLMMGNLGGQLGRPPLAIEEAKDFLIEHLDDQLKEWRPAAELLKKAKSEGISERTLKRAKKDLRVVTEKQGVAFYWKLPY